jgi:hypothetical protein
MRGIEDFLNVIRREANAAVKRRIRSPRHGIVSAYNPARPAVKVKFTEDLDADGNPKETGWIPIAVASAGAGWGIMFAPHLGQHVTVDYANDESNSPFLRNALHSDAEPGIGAPEGEYWMVHQSGTVLKMTATGTVLIGAGAGTFQRLATEHFVLQVYDNHTHPYIPGSNPVANTDVPNQQVSSGDTTNLTAQLKAT